MVGIASGVAAYYLLVGATRYGDASLVAPFRYSRLVFALLLSILILGERPDLLTWLGALIVVFSGYFIVLRERSIKNVKNDLIKSRRFEILCADDKLQSSKPA